MKIILDRQGFKALHTKVDTLTIEGTIRFHGILEFKDEKTAREWIDYNEVGKTFKETNKEHNFRGT